MLILESPPQIQHQFHLGAKSRKNTENSKLLTIRRGTGSCRAGGFYFHKS